MNGTPWLSIAIAVTFLGTLLSGCAALGPTEPANATSAPRPVATPKPTPVLERPSMRVCTDVFRIELEGELPEALTVQALGPGHTSCTTHCPTTHPGDGVFSCQLEPLLPSSGRFREHSQDLPAGSLCATGGAYREAAVATREDGSLCGLHFCCADSLARGAGLDLSMSPGCVYSRGVLRGLEFRDYAPAYLTLVFYLPHQTITTTLVPDYEVYQGVSGSCKIAETTIDLQAQPE